MSTAAPTPVAAPRRALASIDGVDEKTALARFGRLRKLIVVQTWSILALVALLIVVLPFAQPVYSYVAMNPDKQVQSMAGLGMPNMTNKAILSWSVTSIIEIMTFGFGDMDAHLPAQKWRFTDKGWEAFSNAFIRQQIGKTFKQSQLVLTTAPSNTPVIVSQGINVDNVYQWTVQMPVIMTYATNNNVTRMLHAIVSLTIVRAPLEQSPSGIAIQRWAFYAGTGA